MSWHYRIPRHTDGTLALHEVYRGEAGRPDGYTVQPISFAAAAGVKGPHPSRLARDGGGGDRRALC